MSEVGHDHSVSTPELVSSWQQSRQHLLPSTFEERGAVVPFTTPLLAFARVRKDWRDRLELVIGPFAGTAGSYVIAWAAVRDLFALTSHDAYLYEQVMEKKILEPHGIRLAALEAARTGLAGPEAAEAAEHTLAIEAEARVFNEVLIILRVIEEVEKSAAAALMRDLVTEEGQARARRALGAAVRRLDLDPAEFDQRVSLLGSMTYPIGVSWSAEAGRMRRLMQRVIEFGESISSWGEARPPEQAAKAEFCHEVAQHTVHIARRVLEEFDLTMTNPLRLLREWPERGPVLGRHARRLTWLLDGWAAIVELWFEAVGEGRQVVTLDQIMPALPLIPRDEALDEGDRAASNEIALRAKRWVRMNENWRTGLPDPEMTRRLELLKARLP